MMSKVLKEGAVLLQLISHLTPLHDKNRLVQFALQTLEHPDNQKPEKKTCSDSHCYKNASRIDIEGKGDSKKSCRWK